MRLSDAIALGRVTVTKLVASWLDGCALGMAANAVGCERNYIDINKVWPWLYNGGDFQCPKCHRLPDCGMNTIAHFFDTHVMNSKNATIEELCDWVRSIEPAEPIEVSAEQPEVQAPAVAG